MKIAQIAPTLERVPPRFYGGTKRIVSYLTEELVRQGGASATTQCWSPSTFGPDEPRGDSHLVLGEGSCHDLLSNASFTGLQPLPATELSEQLPVAALTLQH